MGSRYGGLKQIDPVGPDNSIIIDYSIYDALRAGFNKVIFIIKKENEELFKEVVGRKVSKFIKVDYVFQDIDFLPKGFCVPVGREKPWGTAHAIYSCKGVVKESFMVINADDFYGDGCFKSLSAWIDRTDFNGKPYKFAMAGFCLKNTLTENGTVSRGVCDVSEDGMLNDVVERTKIMRRNGEIAYTEDGENWVTIPKDSYASMNCWCFQPEFIDEIEQYFIEFLKNDVKNNPLKSEFYLPFVVKDMLFEKKCSVEVLQTADKWFGVTYKEDKPGVVSAIRALIDSGIYPEKLW